LAVCRAVPTARGLCRGGIDGALCEDRSVVEPLRVVAAAILDGMRVLLVCKRAAPDVFYLPGGKPDAGEAPWATLARELGEELGVTLVDSEPLAVVSDQAALERTPMEMHVYLATVAGAVTPLAEIEAVAWVGADGVSPGILAPAVRNYVLPQLAARRLIA
jgi:8-oxo-dGTP diphosphatase